MDIHFLGVSAATPTLTRNLPAVALRLDSGNLILFDAGEDVQRRFEQVNLRFNVPTTICISHMHGDHVVGLLGLLFNFQMGQRTAPLTIIGPQGIYDFLMVNFVLIGLRADYPFEVFEVPIPSEGDVQTEILVPEQIFFYTAVKYPKKEPQIISLNTGSILQTEFFTIQAAWVNHSVPTLGYRFIESDRDGKFNPDVARKVGIPEGPLWGRMQKGEIVTLPDGQQIDPLKTGIVGQKRTGNVIVYSGDTGSCPSIDYLARNATVFICEATYGDDFEAFAREKQHLTGRLAAGIARKSKVQQLILTHYSSRYRDLTLIQNQAREVFPNTIAADDLFTFTLRPNQE